MQRSNVSTALCFVGSHNMNGQEVTSASQWRARQTSARVAFLDGPSLVKCYSSKYLMKLESLFSLVNRTAATLILLDCCLCHVRGERGFLRDLQSQFKQTLLFQWSVMAHKSYSSHNGPLGIQLCIFSRSVMHICIYVASSQILSKIKCEMNIWFALLQSLLNTNFFFRKAPSATAQALVF